MQSEQQQRIMGYFIEEAKDHLGTIEKGLLNLQSTMADSEMIGEVFRAAHSVKGGAAMLGLDSIQKTAHRLEDYFKILKECPVQVDQKLETLLLRVFDTLQDLLGHLQGPFGLTNEKSNEVMAEVEPVFGQLNAHLSTLVDQSGGDKPVDVDLSAQAVAAHPSPSRAADLKHFFQHDVAAALRQLLTLFKQSDTASSRQQLHDICQTLQQQGESVGTTQPWSDLLNAAQRAIAHPSNSYRQLAPVIIKTLKQAQTLGSTNQCDEIKVSAALLQLCPAVEAEAIAPSPSIDSLAATEAFSDLAPAVEGSFEDSFAADNVSDFNDFDDTNLFGEEENAADLFENAVDNTADESSLADSFDLIDTLDASEDETTESDVDDLIDSLDLQNGEGSQHSRVGPQVGPEEMDSLADLFSSGSSDNLSFDWSQDDARVAESDELSDELALEAVNDFSDLLFDQDDAALDDAEDLSASEDDISAILNTFDHDDLPSTEVDQPDEDLPLAASANEILGLGDDLEAEGLDTLFAESSSDLALEEHSPSQDDAGFGLFEETSSLDDSVDMPADFAMTAINEPSESGVEAGDRSITTFATETAAETGAEVEPDSSELDNLGAFFEETGEDWEETASDAEADDTISTATTELLPDEFDGLFAGMDATEELTDDLVDFSSASEEEAIKAAEADSIISDPWEDSIATIIGSPNLPTHDVNETTPNSTADSIGSEFDSSEFDSSEFDGLDDSLFGTNDSTLDDSTLFNNDFDDSADPFAELEEPSDDDDSFDPSEIVTAIATDDDFTSTTEAVTNFDFDQEESDTADNTTSAFSDNDSDILDSLFGPSSDTAGEQERGNQTNDNQFEDSLTESESSHASEIDLSLDDITDADVTDDHNNDDVMADLGFDFSEDESAASSDEPSSNAGTDDFDFLNDFSEGEADNTVAISDESSFDSDDAFDFLNDFSDGEDEADFDLGVDNNFEGNFEGDEAIAPSTPNQSESSPSSTSETADFDDFTDDWEEQTITDSFGLGFADTASTSDHDVDLDLTTRSSPPSDFESNLDSDSEELDFDLDDADFDFAQDADDEHSGSRDPSDLGGVLDDMFDHTAEDKDPIITDADGPPPGISGFGESLDEAFGTDDLSLLSNTPADANQPQHDTHDSQEFDTHDSSATADYGDLDDLLAPDSNSDSDSSNADFEYTDFENFETDNLEDFGADSSDIFAVDPDLEIAADDRTASINLANTAILDHEAEEATADDDFAELDALLSDEMDENVAEDKINHEAEDDFADLDALLSDTGTMEAVSPTPSASPTSRDDEDFADLEKLLDDADQSIGGSPTSKGDTRQASVPTRRPSTRGFSNQTMRVSVKNLDDLNNMVGELVVNRNSLEQSQERLRQFLDNLLYQVQQLSDVGQRMRDLYERSLLESSLLSSRRNQQQQTSILANPTSADSFHATGASFDALEMDRFTGFHTLSQEMIELIVRVRESASDIDFVVDETDQVTRMFRQVTTQLQEGLTRTRMVPFAQAADRLPRAVRDIAIKCGKQAQLVVEGRDTLIDKMILEQLYDPMTHLVNNAITHGIETPENRVEDDKNPVGTITIRSFHQGNQTIISVTDDGGGIDPEMVKQKAIAKGLITPQQAEDMTRLDVYDLLFHHGFSTRDKADDFAGRGVGMDVVRTSLSEIRGVISIDSTIGQGTTFTIRLPLTLSISKALLCISNRSSIAFPMDGVEDMLDIPKDRVQTNNQEQPCILWRDILLPFRPLSDLLKFNRSLGRRSVYGGGPEDDIISVIILRSAGNYLALQVDQVIGEQEIVIKQLESPVPKPAGIAGATVLGDGRIMPIADVLELIDLSMGRLRRESGSSLWELDDSINVTDIPATANEPTVLIVDDSITVRELLSMTFNKVGYRVEQARDGQEAWEKLRSGLPCDLVFCDIEMPRMDGLELLSRLQKDSNFSSLPIAMLTSRGADRHRQMAVQLGAKGYFTKPYLEEALLDAAQRMLKGEVLVGAES